jgi:hypothetical protein
MKSFLQTIGVYSIIGLVITLIVCAILHSAGWVHFSGYLISKEKAVTALTTQGFSDVRVIKRNCSFIKMRGGSSDDDVRFTVEAVNPAGKKVTIYVFAGWPFKSATVRTP